MPPTLSVSSIPVWCPAKQGSSMQFCGGQATMATPSPPVHALAANRTIEAFVLRVRPPPQVWRRPFNFRILPRSGRGHCLNIWLCPSLAARATSAKSGGIFQCQPSKPTCGPMDPQALGRPAGMARISRCRRETVADASSDRSGPTHPPPCPALFQSGSPRFERVRHWRSARTAPMQLGPHERSPDRSVSGRANRTGVRA